MLIDVTKYVTEIDCSLFSSSIHESGLQNIGEITFNNALNHVVAIEGILKPGQMDEGADYLVSTGGWTQKEIESWGDDEINAVVLQFIAGAVREYEKFETYEEYQEAAEEGRASGNLWRNDATWTYYLGE